MFDFRFYVDSYHHYENCDWRRHYFTSKYHQQVRICFWVVYLLAGGRCKSIHCSLIAQEQKLGKTQQLFFYNLSYFWLKSSKGSLICDHIVEQLGNLYCLVDHFQVSIALDFQSSLEIISWKILCLRMVSNFGFSCFIASIYNGSKNRKIEVYGIFGCWWYRFFYDLLNHHVFWRNDRKRLETWSLNASLSNRLG